jgi:hypothetical protein
MSTVAICIAAGFVCGQFLSLLGLSLVVGAALVVLAFAAAFGAVSVWTLAIAVISLQAGYFLAVIARLIFRRPTNANIAPLRPDRTKERQWADKFLR